MKTITVPFFIAHQGCPHRCVFCDQVKISGGREDLPGSDAILERIASYRETAGSRDLEVAFFGGTFTSLPAGGQERLLAPLQPLLARGELSSVRVSTRPDAIDAATAAFLRERGVGTVELGIQSLDDSVLASAGRGHTARDAENACRLLSAAGFRVGLQLMPGLPGESRATALATLRRALALEPAFLRIYPTLVLAGTELERLYRAGSYVPPTLPGAVSLCKVMLQEAMKASVPVVRIGLQATEDLRKGAIVAGPWHPAFRQLVEAELFFDLMAKLSSGLPPRQRVTFVCSPSRVSDAAGQRRANLTRLGGVLKCTAITIKPDSRLSRVELRMEADAVSRTGSILVDLDYTGEDSTHA